MITTTTLIEKIRLNNGHGLHLRAAARLVQLASQFHSYILVRYEEKTANAKSVLNVLAMGVHKGGELEISADGKDARSALAAIRRLIEDNFGEAE